MEIDLVQARKDIEETDDLLARAVKLSGLLTTLFQRRGIPLVVVGGSAVEFYTEGGYMSGDVDFCRRTLKGPSPRLTKEILESVGGTCIGRNWKVCGLFVDLLGVVESETVKPYREVSTTYGVAYVLPPELALVERTFYALDSVECRPAARQMMTAALADAAFDWDEAERLADLADFKILPELRALRREVEACS